MPCIGRKKICRRSPRTDRSETVRVSWVSPLRLRPVTSDLAIELLPFWATKSDEPIDQIPAPTHVVHPISVRTVRELFRNLNPRALAPKRRFACFTIVALLVIPVPVLLDWMAPSFNRRSLARRASSTKAGLMVVAVYRSERPFYFRFETPEIPGRTRFLIIAIGRSPPAAGPTIR